MLLKLTEPRPQPDQKNLRLFDTHIDNMDMDVLLGAGGCSCSCFIRIHLVLVVVLLPERVPERV